ncbi:hypothetical protein HAX54_011860 [Datura stramonium]|uniref:R13L1/DRL21-like LRR repeat region domain-containing protein n=1 Tax=Datura stramonium TaxID=4076 RepID=A0ABS8TIT6_DATST|nr:hypothetical protein [Datura stramonium]
MPSQISRLKNLIYLSKFIMGKGKELRIQDLGELQHLHGDLHISGLENVINGRDAASANLKDKKLIENLVMEWSDSDVEDSLSVRDTLDKLQPHRGLKSLKLCHVGGTRFPDWLGDNSFVNLETLHLESCNCFSLPALGQLASLKLLTTSKMDEIRNVGQEFYGDNSTIRPFQSLIFLKFEQMMAWERWQILSNGVFSSLEELHISKCPQLTGDFPSELLSLKQLVMTDCPKLILPHDGMTTLHIQGGFLQHLPSLRKMHMYGMPNLQEFPLSRLPLSLKELLIGTCDVLKFELVPDDTTGSCNTSLKTLTIENCDLLRDIPLGMFPGLQVLSIIGCKNLQTISVHCVAQTLNLQRLTIRNCDKLKLLPTQMNNVLQSLAFLNLNICQEIERFPEGGLPSSLQILYIIGCKKLMTN